jgi:glycosyltransferase involved in cell wall biosynthesis
MKSAATSPIGVPDPDTGDYVGSDSNEYWDMRLTVGVSCQNGLPHLSRCLASLPALVGCAEKMDFILVDAASSDGTLATMLAFASGRPDTRVYSMSGIVNLAATRNVILSKARPGAVFLVDGDIAVSPAFVDAALEEFRAGRCEIAYGRLPEILYDKQARPYGRTVDRYKVADKGYAKHFGGVVMFAPQLLAEGVRYDETLRRAEDLALSTALADKFRIQRLPIEMGVHHSVAYYHPDRIGDFYRKAYMRPYGRLIVDNLTRPWRIWNVRRGISGYVLGFALVVFLLGAIVSGSLVAVALAVAAIAFDLARFYRQGRLSSWVPTRLVGMAQLVWGVVLPERQRLDYVVRERFSGTQSPGPDIAAAARFGLDPLGASPASGARRSAVDRRA